MLAGRDSFGKTPHFYQFKGLNLQLFFHEHCHCFNLLTQVLAVLHIVAKATSQVESLVAKKEHYKSDRRL